MDPRALVESRRLWYHTLDLAPGVATPGWFDLRPIVAQLPWPDLRNKRCLDVGTYDGFLAFEMERRGAKEVIATDISDPADWDWAIRQREMGVERIRERAGDDPSAGFKIAKQVLGSRVERVERSVYDLSVEELGSFDFITCGSLLLHLRDPVRALEAVRSVCSGRFLSMETIRLGLTLTHRRRAMAEFRAGMNCQWWITNAAGHRQLLQSAGFEIERASKPYTIPFGPGHPKADQPARRSEHVLAIAISGRPGVPHSAVLARPLAELDA